MKFKGQIVRCQPKNIFILFVRFDVGYFPHFKPTKEGFVGKASQGRVNLRLTSTGVKVSIFCSLIDWSINTRSDAAR